jgi:hypothetical protein
MCALSREGQERWRRWEWVAVGVGAGRVAVGVRRFASRWREAGCCCDGVVSGRRSVCALSRESQKRWQRRELGAGWAALAGWRLGCAASRRGTGSRSGRGMGVPFLELVVNPALHAPACTSPQTREIAPPFPKTSPIPPAAGPAFGLSRGSAQSSPPPGGQDRQSSVAGPHRGWRCWPRAKRAHPTAARSLTAPGSSPRVCCRLPARAPPAHLASAFGLSRGSAQSSPPPGGRTVSPAWLGPTAAGGLASREARSPNRRPLAHRTWQLAPGVLSLTGPGAPGSPRQRF